MQNNFYFIGNYSNIYKKPSKLSEVTSQIICGEKFKILSKNKSWIKIKLLFDNYVGYIQDKQFTQKTNLDYKVTSLKARIFKKPNVETKS
ncbi:multi-domain protein, partial [Candidatus Pelagibacter sp.]|nr:multi-domain protein [Candidatus Pelagibacter sp.]